MQARTLGRGAQLVGDGEQEWKVSRLLYADDTVLAVKRKLKNPEFFLLEWEQPVL